MKKEEFINGARLIADRLLEDAVQQEHGLTWETMSLGDNREITMAAGEGIYSGSAGIILFLIELYNVTGEEKYKETVRKAVPWLLWHAKENDLNYYAYFTGRLGTVHTLIKAGRFLGEEKYVHEGLELIRNVDDYTTADRLIDDLINGVSGALVGLIHIYDETGEEWLLEKIDILSRHLIKRASIGHKGLYWDRSNQSIRGLCGFSHGASGVSWSFLELGRYFNLPAYNWLAYQGFNYENNYFNTEKNNWPDFRKGIFDDDTYDEHKQAYLKGDREFFNASSDMAAWCHGAPGIALSRIRAYEVLGDDSLKNDALRALDKTRAVTLEYDDTTKGSFTVCHGRGGNAMSLLEAARHWQESSFAGETEKIAESILEELKEGRKFISGFAFAKDQEDRSLYMGNAGIGYFLLQQAHPEKVPSVVMPVLNTTVKDKDAALAKAPGLDLKEWEIKEMVLAKDFARTIILLKKAFSEEQRKGLFDFHTSDLVTGFHRQFEKMLPYVENEEQRAQVADVYKLEKAKADMDREIESCAFLQVKNMLHHEYVEEQLKDNEERLQGLSLELDKDTRIITTDYDWSAEDEMIDFHSEKSEEESYSLLKAQALGISEFPLNEFSYLVIETFRDGGTLEEAFDKTKGEFDLESEEEEKQLYQLVANQVKEAVFSGILLVKQTELEAV
ncbi:MAG: lanthionine synthetase LanC family protein [Cyclobacteriaceae bacterium]